MANKMAEIAEMIGVRLNEEFQVKNLFFSGSVGITKCKITEYGLYSWCDGGGEEKWFCDYVLLSELLVGDDSVEIIKEPFVPKENELYWTLEHTDLETKWYTWENCLYDFMRLKCGMAFRTEAEAIEARPRICKELMGKEWTE